MMDQIFTNGTEELWFYRDDIDPHDCMFYVATTRYGDEACMIPVFKCSDSWISYFFGLTTTSNSNRKAVQLNVEDTATVIEKILGDNPDDYKPNAVIFGEFVREFQGYTFKMVFSPEYHLWKSGGENQYYDVKIGKTEFSFTFSPAEYINALIMITVPDEDVREVLFAQLDMM